MQENGINDTKNSRVRADAKRENNDQRERV
jgi:hypothetical protein